MRFLRTGQFQNESPNSKQVAQSKPDRRVLEQPTAGVQRGCGFFHLETDVTFRGSQNKEQEKL